LRSKDRSRKNGKNGANYKKLTNASGKSQTFTRDHANTRDNRHQETTPKFCESRDQIHPNLTPAFANKNKVGTIQDKAKPRQPSPKRPSQLQNRSAQSLSPRKKPKDLDFDLGPIKPSDAKLCKACGGLVPPTPRTPEVNAPARTPLESQLMSSILQARGRAVNIQSAYTNAKAEFTILGNQDESWEHKIGIPPDPSVAPKDGMPGCTDNNEVPREWMHAPYTVELAKGVGKLVGELGRALASNQQSLALMEEMLGEEQR
jgi:hypothetical protein